MDFETRLRSAGEHTGNLILITVIFAFYVLAVLAVFTGFATYMFRTEWAAELSASDAVLSDIDSVFFAIKREENIVDDLAYQKADLDYYTTEQINLAARLEAQNMRKAELEAERQQEAYAAIAAVRSFDDMLSEPDRQKIASVVDQPAQPLVLRAEKAVEIIGAAALIPGSTPSRSASVNQQIVKLQDKIAARRSELQDIAAQIERLEVDHKNVAAGLSRTGTAIADGEAALAALRQTIPVTSPARARLDALSGKYVGDLFRRMVSLPTIFLLLMVTIAAGALGSVVSFSRAAFAGRIAPNLAGLFVGVGEGVAAAIAIFLLSGAGMLVLTQGGGTDGQVELSPYTVAFMAFVSGFMAEDAFNRIQRAGRQFFGSNGEDGHGEDGLSGDEAEKEAAAKA